MTADKVAAQCFAFFHRVDGFMAMGSGLNPKLFQS